MMWDRNTQGEECVDEDLGVTEAQGGQGSGIQVMN